MRAFALMLLALFALTACDVIAPASGGASASGASNAPLIQIAQSPADVVRSFLNAWSSGDYNAMYALLSPQSQGLTPFSTFQAIYTQADETLGRQGVSYTIHRTDEQGDSAAVRYDAVIESNIFGSIADEGRVTRVVRAPGDVWRIAWTQMDIVNGYAPGTRLTVNAIRPPRGNIYDRRGQLMVEHNAEVVEIYLVQQDIPDFDGCVYLLGVLLRRSESELIEIINGYNPETVFPIGDLDPDIYNARQAELDARCRVRTNTRETRRYAGHGIATHLVGYVGSIPAEDLPEYEERGYAVDDLIGLAGVEAAYEEELAGSAERVLQIIEPGGLIVRELGGSSGSPAYPVTLTLDLNLQWTAAQALSDAFNDADGNWAAPEHSPGGGAVVIDVNTGAILALASYPSFDPGIFNPDTPIFLVGNYIADLRNDPTRPFSNRVTQEQYPPGSVFKIVTTAAAAEEGIFRPDEIFNCTMEWDGREFGDTQERRLDWRATEVLEEARYATGEVTMAQALTASCNPFFYQMGALLYRQGPSTLMDYARRMGLGRATGLAPIVPEAAGQLTVINGVDAGISAAIGQQDTQVTIIQMARLVAGIANGGTLFEPYVVAQVGGRDDTEAVFNATPRVAGEMGLSDATLEVVREGMCAVTTDETVGRSTGQPLGTAWFVFDDPEGTGIAPYSVCGKTGTAQTGRVEPHGWFVAYAPADEPQIAVAVMIEHSREGSETAAPIVRRIMDAYFGAPQAPFPWWWSENTYVPLNIPEGSTGG